MKIFKRYWKKKSYSLIYSADCKLIPLALLSAVTSLVAAEIPSAIMPAEHEAIISEYCLDCHDAETRKASIELWKTLKIHCATYG